MGEEYGGYLTVPLESEPSDGENVCSLVTGSLVFTWRETGGRHRGS